MGLFRSGVRWRATVRLLVLVAVTALAPGPAFAAAPPPPLDDCLKKGSFNIADPVCGLYQPETGNPFGPIAGTQIVLVERGVPRTLAAPGGAAIDFDPPKDHVCGENGCPRNAIRWRRGLSFHPGIGFTKGCNATDITCTVTYAPPLVGDAGEIYQVVYAEQYLGIQPTGNSRMFAFYTPPTVYPVRLDPVDTGGSRLALPSGYTAFAIRPGANPTQAACVDPFWYTTVLSQATFPVPDCITLRYDGYLDGRENWFGGWLPNDTGTWTVVAAPRGDVGAPLLTRPSPYRRTSLTPNNDDLLGTVVAERRPGLSMEVRPETTVMDIGTTQIVDVIVAAEGGESGGLEGLRFEDAGVLALTGSDAALEVLGVSEEVPAGGFTLGVGEQRVFSVELLAVGLGEGAVSAAVAGNDDLGQALRVEQGGPILVEYAESDAADAPAPPVVERALDTGVGGVDVVEGGVEGTPETTVTVSLATSAVGADDTCTRLMSGDGVTALGPFPVTIGTDGVGRFVREGALDPGQYVYGITVKGPSVSAVGGCTPVSEVTPSLTIDDAEVTEGTGKEGATALTFTVALSGPGEQAVTVDISAADGTASAPADFTRVGPTTVSFAPGEVSKVFTVEVVRDAKEEPDEDLVVTLSNPVSATIEAGMATGTIVDDDTAGSGASVDRLDLRGTWAVDVIPPEPGGSASMEIRTHDQDSGKLTGSVTIVYQGKIFVEKLTGTISGDRLALSWAGAKTSGSLVTRGGKVTATMTGRDSQGTRITYRMTLTDPRGG